MNPIEFKRLLKEFSQQLNEADEIKLTQLEIDTLKSFEDDLKTIKQFAGTVFKEVLEAQSKFTKQYGFSSAVFDNYMKIVMNMVPITTTLGNTEFLLGAMKQGKFGSEIKLSNVPPNSPKPPPVPPMPPKVKVPPPVKMPPPPPTKKGPPPPPTRKGPPPPPTRN
jgi:hypothetical protein